MEMCGKCYTGMVKGGAMNSGNAEFVTMMCPNCGFMKTMCTGIKTL